jgi:glycosyltransferase involved in cell wall biosynthesis
LVVLPNFIDVDEIDRRAAQPAPELDPARFHLIAVGRLNPQKGHLDLLQAMTQLVHQRHSTTCTCTCSAKDRWKPNSASSSIVTSCGTT